MFELVEMVGSVHKSQHFGEADLIPRRTVVIDWEYMSIVA